QKAVNISWNKVKDADRYVIYLSQCNDKGTKYTMKKIKTVSGKTLKWTKKGLKKKTAYKFYIKALKKSGKNYKVIAKSKNAHFFTGGFKGKYTDPKSLKLKKSKLTLKKGKSATIKGIVTKVKKNKKLATSHAVKLRFISNNPSVATVNAKGKVTAKKAGTATIYVQTINGIWKTCKVTVK
ncbi:MAG: Ig-like domain-containing protein, partial [Firmicutes bacterium]|nr:Ig-like domain-containing protein [Bacillota bacterium]